MIYCRQADEIHTIDNFAPPAKFH